MLQRLLFAFCCVFASFSITAIAANAGDSVSITVPLNNSEIVKLPRDMHHVVIANRAVAGVVKHSARSVAVTGNGVGVTDIRVMDANKKIVRQINVRVTYDLPAARRLLKTLLPNENIGIEVVNQSLALTGNVADAESATRAFLVLQEFVKSQGGDPEGAVLNFLKVESGQQVMLRVRIGELQRTALKRLGLGVHGVISGGDAIIGALERDEVFKVLAEPNLTAISGESAKFLAGGEFPVPIAQGNQTMSVEYKPFGVGLNFTPTVYGQKRVRLTVESEVSEISDVGAVITQSIKIPAISTRRAQTTVELAPGESFMIAGLLKDSHNARVSEIPGLADIPVLGALFRSAAFRRNETELVIAVTPYLVSGVPSKDVRLPTDDYRTPSMMEMMFYGALGSNSGDGFNKGQTPKLEGPAGFLTE